MDSDLQLLSEIFEIGERMCAALEDGDVEQFGVLVQQRGALMEGLKAGAAGRGSEEWETLAAKLREQHETLQALIGHYESRVQETLEGFNRFKGARKSYAAPQARPGILDRRLEG